MAALIIESALELVDVPGGRQRSTVIVCSLKRAIEPLPRGADEQCEQQFFFIESGEFLAYLVTQVAFKNFAVAIAQEGIFANRARENAFVHAENEERAERQAARRRGAEYHDAVTVAAVIRYARAFEPVLKGIGLGR